MCIESEYATYMVHMHTKRVAALALLLDSCEYVGSELSRAK